MYDSYFEVFQDPDVTDSDMLEKMRELIADGHSWVDYTSQYGIKRYVFKRVDND